MKFLVLLSMVAYAAAVKRFDG